MEATRLSWRPPPGAYGFSLTVTLRCPLPSGTALPFTGSGCAYPEITWPCLYLASPPGTGPWGQQTADVPLPLSPLCSHARSCGPDVLPRRTTRAPSARRLLRGLLAASALPGLRLAAFLGVPCISPATSTLVPLSSRAPCSLLLLLSQQPHQGREDPALWRPEVLTDPELAGL